MRILVAGRHHQSLPRERLNRSLGNSIDFGIAYFVSVVDSTKLDRALRGFRQAHPGAAALAEDAFVRNLIVFRFAAEFLGCNFLQPLAAFGRNGMRCTRHGMRSLAAARY